jgi:hypothetical protein
VNIRSTVASIALAATVVVGVGIISAGPSAAQSGPISCTWPLEPVEVGGVWACRPAPPIHHHDQVVDRSAAQQSIPANHLPG